MSGDIGDDFIGPRMQVFSEYVGPEREIPGPARVTHYTYYRADGKIVQSGFYTEGDFDLPEMEDCTCVLMASNPSTDYVRITGGLPEVLPRPVFTVSKTEIIADGEDAAVITGVPYQAEVAVDGTMYVVTDGTIEIVSVLPKTITVEIDHFPWLPFSVKIVAGGA